MIWNCHVAERTTLHVWYGPPVSVILSLVLLLVPSKPQCTLFPVASPHVGSTSNVAVANLFTARLLTSTAINVMQRCIHEVLVTPMFVGEDCTCILFANLPPRISCIWIVNCNHRYSSLWTVLLSKIEENDPWRQSWGKEIQEAVSKQSGLTTSIIGPDSVYTPQLNVPKTVNPGDTPGKLAAKVGCHPPSIWGRHRIDR